MNKYINILSLFLYLIVGSQIIAQHESKYDPDESLKKLIKGNKRFAGSEMTHQNQSSRKVEELAEGQHPFAVIVSCSDSRVPPEIVFDQGLGDLFVIRSAGNLVDDIGLGSIEYAVEHLGVNLIVVLGHERCGAVSAAVQGGEAPGHIAKLIEVIKPSVENAKKQPGDLAENALISNIKMVVNQLKNTRSILKEFVHDRKLKIAGARYDLDEGTVELIK